MSIPPPNRSMDREERKNRHPRFFLDSTGPSPVVAPFDSHPYSNRSDDGSTHVISSFISQSWDETLSGHQQSRPYSSQADQSASVRSGPFTHTSRNGDGEGDQPTSMEFFPGVMSTDDTDISPIPSPLTDRHHVNACLEIHRALYRGREGSAHWTWKDQAPLVQSVVEQLIDDDCKYDHPLVQIVSRQSVLTHFILLHLCATGYIPHPTPSNIIQIMSNLTSHVRYRLMSSDGGRNTDIESNPMEPVDIKGKGKMRSPLSVEILDTMPRENEGKWWRLWDISGNCRDIGNLHTQTGNHFTLIDHVVTLTLFPALVKRDHHDNLYQRSLPSTTSMCSLDNASAKSFTERLISAVAQELDYLLRWDLPISTTVRFNENGKATQIRDTVDLRDVVETFVPFAKRLGWLSRRITGLLSSTIGTVALAVAPTVTLPEVPVEKQKRLASPIGLGLDFPPSALTSRSLLFADRNTETNLLGLQGVPTANRTV